jgi:hypothetical protein
MRQDLAVALVSVFGGNVALVINAVESLKERKEDFQAFHCLQNIEGARSVDSLLDDSAEDKAIEDAVERILSSISKVGYCNVPTKASKLSAAFKEQGLAGIVSCVDSLDRGWSQPLDDDDDASSILCHPQWRYVTKLQAS